MDILVFYVCWMVLPSKEEQLNTKCYCLIDTHSHSGDHKGEKYFGEIAKLFITIKE
jgi:hypothetical protein